VDARIEVGASGQFDVFVDGEVVATKHAVGLLARLRGNKGFPDDDEAVEAVRAKVAATS